MDGFALRLLERMGIGTACITGRTSGVVLHRMADLRVRHVIQGSSNKLADLRRLAAATGVAPEQMAYIGDDWPDLGVMRAVGYPIAPANAAPQVKALARHVCTLSGGNGALREAVEHILARLGRLDEAVRLYDEAHAPAKPASPRY